MKNFATNMAGILRRLEALEQDKGATLRFANVVGTSDGQVRVQLVDGQGVVTAPLPTIQRRVLKDQEVKLPDIGEPVAVLFSGKGFESGLILGAVYSQNIPNPKVENHIEYKKFEDGTEIFYDRKKHLLMATVEGDVDITVRKNLIAVVDKDVDITVNGGLTAEVKGDVNIQSLGNINLSAQEKIILKSNTSVDIASPVINLVGNLSSTGVSGEPGKATLSGEVIIENGNLSVSQGNITANKVAADKITSGNIILSDHVHGGVLPGPSITSPPVGA